MNVFRIADNLHINKDVELPPPPDTCLDADNRRLWIGNIDHRLTEYTLLKLLQKYGEIEKFDFLCHKTGPEKGKPRGFCFVTYKVVESADRARSQLHGKQALSKRLLVKLAHLERETNPVKLETAAVKPHSSKPHSQIKAIEAKLKAMEQQPNDFELDLGSKNVQPTVKAGQDTCKSNRKLDNKPYSTKSVAHR